MSDVAAQIQAIDSGALLRPMPELGTLIVTGEERQSWLSAVLTNDIKSLEIGRGCYALSVNKVGRIQSDVWVLTEQERVLLGVPSELAEGLRDAMDHYLVMEDAELAVCDVQHVWWLAYGPQAAAVAEAARGEGAATVTGALGELTVAIIAVPAQSNPNIGEALCAVKGALLATPDGWERIRVERMLPALGVDFKLEDYPHEGRLERLAVSFNKGCYLGQEAVFKIEQRGHVAKRLVRLVLDEEAAIETGAPITTVEGDDVGTVTSAVAGDGKTFALGVVRYKQSSDGTALRVADKPATVSCPEGR